MTRRHVDLGDDASYETCDPEPADPRTKEALADMARAAVRHLKEQQRTRWEYHREAWGWPSLAQADQRLANLGEDGWELAAIAALGGLWAIFKRPSYAGAEGEGRE